MKNILFEKKFTQGIYRVYDESPENVIHLKQVHGNRVFNRETIKDKKNLSVEGDGINCYWQDFMQSTTPLIAIKTADCLPIVVIGKKGFSILHAGWKGVQQKILLAPEVALLNPEIIFIGPSIQPTSFEVTEEFKNYFPQSKNFLQKEDKLFFHLQNEIFDQAKYHYPSCELVDSQIDTLTNNHLRSFRRSKTATLSNWNIFEL